MKKIVAPVKAGDSMGTIDYYIDGEKIGSVNIISDEDAAAADLKSYISMIFKEILL